MNNNEVDINSLSYQIGTKEHTENNHSIIINNNKIDNNYKNFNNSDNKSDNYHNNIDNDNNNNSSKNDKNSNNINNSNDNNNSNNYSKNNGNDVRNKSYTEGTKHRKRIYIRHRNKTFSTLLKQSDALKKKYKPGKFEEVINGPRGPDVRLHRHKVIVGLLKLLLILFITAGIVLLTVIMLCITINVGYVCVQIDDVNSFVQLLFFAFYFDALYYIMRSFWRTYLRAIHSIIHLKIGSSINDIFIKRVLGYFLSLKIAQWTMPEKYKEHPKDWYERVNLTIFIIFLILCFVPVILIACIFGYWKITGTICLLFVGGGAVTIVILNLFSRLILFIKFFRRLDEFYYNAPFYLDINERIDNQTSYLRLTYCTTNGLEGGESSLNYVLDLLIHMIISIGVAAFIFGSFDPDVWKITIIIVALVILLPIRYRKNLRKFLVKCHILSKEKLDKKNEKIKNKVNAEMDATHKNYIDNKKNNDQIMNKVKKVTWLNKFRSKSSLFRKRNSKANIDINNNDQQQVHNANWNKPKIDMDNNENNNNIDNNIDINISDETISNDANSFIDMQDAPSSSNVANISNININKQDPFMDNANSLQPNSIADGNEINAKSEKLEDDSFNYILNSSKPFIRRKALLTWDIKTLITWKGCLTIFITRFIKYVVGITFMAFLNYYRYSENSDYDKTSDNLNKDAITHVIFILLLLCQDILYLIPVPSFQSMKARKFLFMTLIIIEFIFVIGMRAIITNGYIPMAFIVLAYANFLVYPDPRYTWDDENATRKTFFDLFNPDLNLRSEINYEHYDKKRGYRFNRSDKTTTYNGAKKLNKNLNNKNNTNTNTKTNINANNNNNNNNNNHSNKYLSTSNVQTTTVGRHDNNENKIVESNNSKFSNMSNNFKNKGKNMGDPEIAIPSFYDSSDYIFDGINEEIISYDSITESNNDGSPKNIYIDIDGQDYKVTQNKKNPEMEFQKAVKNIRTEMQYNRNTRARYNSTAILMVTFLFILASLIVGIMFAGSADEDFTKDRGVDKLLSPKPAICQWRGDNITINEFASLSCACYYKTTKDVMYSYLYSRPSTSTNNFTIGDNNINSESGVQFVDFVNNETNTIVVAIRGTSTMEDIFQDIYIWSASALLQLSGFFGTFIKFWPRETIAGLVKFIVKQFTNFQLLYWVDVEEHIINLRKANPTTNIYLTGHSLGGGVAGVISAHLNIPAITFSSPGLGYSYKTYDIELKKLINNFVNVVPMSDPVPLLDSQVGQIQNIECNSEEPLSCHSIYNTMDTLSEMCSERSVYRYWDNTIEAKINGKDIPHVMPY